MDKATVGGLAMGTGLLLLAIMIAPGSSFAAFIDPASAAVVIGGAVAATCIAFPISTLLLFPKVFKKTFSPNQKELLPVISKLVEFSEVARREGILALENNASEIDDPFLLLGIQMAVDGTDADVLEKILRSEMESLSARHRAGKSLFDTMGRFAPAFGMIGTLMGLIIMLGNMDDPDAIGPGMAVALITTLYGAVLSNLVFLPLSEKLSFYSKRELEIREVILRGILAIQCGDNPRIVEQKLKTALPVPQRGANLRAA